MRVSALFVLLIVLSVSCKSRTLSDLSISGGRADFNQSFVVPLINDHGNVFCSATFVSNNIAISAAHCFVKQGQTSSHGVFVITEQDVRYVKTIVLPKKYGVNEADKTQGHNYNYDVAVLFFDDQVKVDHVSMELEKGLQVQEKDLKILGFGCNKVISPYLKEGSPLWQAYHNRLISWSSPDHLFVKEVKSHSYIIKGSLQIPNTEPHDVTVCPGDSGGGLFHRGKLVGVTSLEGRGSSIFVNLNNIENSNFVKNAVARQWDESHMLFIHSSLNQEILESSKTHHEMIEKVRSRLLFVKQNKSQIIKELNDLHSQLSRLINEAEARKKRLAESHSIYSARLNAVLRQLQELQNKYSSYNVQVFPIVLDHTPPQFPPSAIVHSLRECEFHLYKVDLNMILSSYEFAQKLHDDSVLFRYETINSYDSSFIYDHFVMDKEEKPVPIEVREIPPYHGEASTLPLGMMIFPDIHFSQAEDIVLAVNDYAQRKDWRDRTFIVPVATLRYVEEYEMLQIVKLSALVIQGGVLRETVQFKDK